MEVIRTVNPKLLITIAFALVFGLGTQAAEAGTVRFAGKKIAQGSTAVAAATADGAQATGDGVAEGGKATGGALKTAVMATGKGAKATPGLTVKGIQGAGKGIARAIW